MSTFAAAGIAVLGSGIFVMSASYSSFTSTTSNGSNSWTAGSVHLTDDDSGSALFTATGNLKPGSTGTNCITVTSTGSLPSPVKLYASVADTGLAQYMTVQIEAGTGGGFGSCSGFTPSTPTSSVFNSTLNTLTATNYANGLTALWTTTGAASESKVYRVTYTLSASTPDTAQGKAVTTTLTWEAQNS